MAFWDAEVGIMGGNVVFFTGGFATFKNTRLCVHTITAVICEMSMVHKTLLPTHEPSDLRIVRMDEAWCLALLQHLLEQRPEPGSASTRHSLTVAAQQGFRPKQPWHLRLLGAEIVKCENMKRPLTG